MKKSLFYLRIAAVILTAAFAACTSEIMTLPIDVSLDKNLVTLLPGESITLTAGVIPDEAVVKTLSWSSSNPGVAMVDNGVVTALAEGDATITVTVNTRIGPKKRSCKLTVAYPVRSVTIDQSASYLLVGESMILTAEVLPDDAPDKTITWSSSNPEVAEIADGVVTAQKPGKAIITVTTTVGERIATCPVRVFAGKYMAMTFQDSQNATILMSGSGTIEMDWGDGSAGETYTLSPAIVSYSHNYSETSSGMITIEGEGVVYLDCKNLQLTSLDVSKNFELTDLNCSNNQLMDLDVRNNTALKVLNCSNNLLINLDVTNNTALSTLGCIRNQLTSLVVSANTTLENLNCSYNQLKNLDVSSNIMLTTLECARNQLTGLKINNHTGLTILNCSNNQLVNLDVSSYVTLEYLNCSYNQIKNLDVSKNTALTILDCANNQIKRMDVSKNLLTEFNFDNNPLISLDVSNTFLTSLSISNSTIEELIVSNNDLLETLNCSKNKLTTLVVSGNFALRDLDCSNNQLTSLDVNTNTNLRTLLCNRNQLISLDVTKNTMLYLLDCQSNQLSVEAINDLFSSLHSRPISWMLDGQIKYNKYICIYLNPGANRCDLSLVKNKGWEVFYTSDYN